MKNIFQEIHDRSLWQILGLYVAGSWVVLQVVDTLNSTLEIPAWVIPSAYVLLAIGLPMVMVTAFLQKGWRRRAVQGAPKMGATARNSSPGEMRSVAAS